MRSDHPPPPNRATSPHHRARRPRTSSRSGRPCGPGSASRCRPSAAPPGRSPSSSAPWSKNDPGSGSNASTTRRRIACSCPGPKHFTQCFLFILLGAPYVERLRGNQAISAALTGITAVVGVIANLAVYFANHTLFTTTHDRDWSPVHLQVPDLTTVRPTIATITLTALIMILRRRWSVLRTLGISARLGLATTLIW